MEIKRFYLACLAHASYMIHDGDEAAVIDPQRDVDLYVDEARQLGLRIRWVIETHLHADFVSGHLELASRTGATICIGAGSGALFDHRDLQENDELPLGSARLRILSTPGHTEESICIVAIESGKKDPTRRLHRRHALYRRCWPPRPVPHQNSAGTGLNALRQPAPKALDSPR